MAFVTVLSETVVGVEVSHATPASSSTDRQHLVRTEDGTKVMCDALIIATGATARRLHFPGADTFWTAAFLLVQSAMEGSCVSRQDTSSWAERYSHGRGAFLTRFARRVVIVLQRGAAASNIMAERARAHPKIEWRLDAEVVCARGEGGSDSDEDEMLGSVKLSTGEELPCSGLFFGIGHDPATEFLRGSGVALDADGYVIVPPGKTGTNVEGVFACGDVMDKEWRQAVTAAGTGCMAALEAERWLATSVSEGGVGEPRLMEGRMKSDVQGGLRKLSET